MYGRTLTHSFNLVAGVVVLLTVALAGCGGGGGGGTIGVSGSGAGSGSNPGGTVGPGGGTGSGGGTVGGNTYTATAIVTSGGVPKPGVTVTLTGGVVSTPPNPASVIATQVTDAQGLAVFPGLIKGMNYCFTASFTDNTGSHQVVSCSNTSDTTVLLRF